MQKACEVVNSCKVCSYLLHFSSTIIVGNRRSEMIQEVPQAEEEKGDEEKKDDEKPVEKTGTCTYIKWPVLVLLWVVSLYLVALDTHPYFPPLLSFSLPPPPSIPPSVPAPLPSSLPPIRHFSLPPYLPSSPSTHSLPPSFSLFLPPSFPLSLSLLSSSPLFFLFFYPLPSLPAFVCPPLPLYLSPFFLALYPIPFLSPFLSCSLPPYLPTFLFSLFSPLLLHVSTYHSFLFPRSLSSFTPPYFRSSFLWIHLFIFFTYLLLIFTLYLLTFIFVYPEETGEVPIATEEG